MSLQRTVICNNPQLADGIGLDAFKHYFQHSGWRYIGDFGDTISVFEGPNNDFGQPIRLVLPSKEEFLDAPLLKSKILNSLSIIEDCSIEEMRQKILKS